MSEPGAQAPQPTDSAPLQSRTAAHSSSGSLEEQQGASDSSLAQQNRLGGFLSWLRGRRTDLQPVPSDEEGSSNSEELQERPPSCGAPPAPPSVAVVVEQGASGSGAQQQQQQQQQQPAPDEAGASGSGSGGGGEIEAHSRNGRSSPLGGSPRMGRLASLSRGPPTCLICLEEFTQEEFINGSALRLECNCRGDLALRHRDCVMKWVQVKGSNVCELCKAEIRNIPAPPPRAAEADLPQLDAAYFDDPSHIHDFMPSSQDLVFDCIRVTWVAMIVSILFFEMSLGAALWTGLLAGFAYSIMVRLMYRQHFYAMRRLAEQQAAAARGEGGGGPPIVVAV